ncbi:VOC family protein [Loktanella agnita]|uniref:VOC family protein n=1 Tax=Loktanella agnita TaxID=287097 RepID=UPI0039868642
MSTLGIDHLGLTTANLPATRDFFRDVLGWRETGSDPGYPMIVMTDGHARLTLWARRGNGAFDRHANAGLHHLCLAMQSEEALGAAYARAQAMAGVEPEFAPEPNKNGPAIHTMLREPGGCRIELRYTPPKDTA